MPVFYQALLSFFTPKAPTNLTATANSTSQITVNWISGNQAGTALSYNIYRSIGNGVFIGPIANVGPNTLTSNSFVDTGLQPSTQYNYKVTAMTVSGNEGPPGGPVSAITQSTGVTAGGYDGVIQVVNGVLQNGHNQPIQLRGANMSGMENSPIQGFAPWQDDGVPNWSVYQTWKPNVVRIPMNAQSWLGLTVWQTATTTSWGASRLADPQGNYRAAIATAIQNARAIGCYVILDCHWSAPQITLGGVTHILAALGQSAFADIDCTLPFWQSIAQTYGGSRDILFELFNEPFLDSFGGTLSAGSADVALLNGGTSNRIANNSQGGANFDLPATWTLVGYQQLINTIRSAGANNICICNGNSFTQQLQNYLAYLPSDVTGQFAFGWHPYPHGTYPYTNGDVFPKIGNDAGAGTANAVQWASAISAAPHPVIITEDGGEGGTNATSGEPHMTYMQNWADSHNQSYIFWQWNATQPFGTAQTNNLATVFASNGTTILPIQGEGQEAFNWMTSHGSVPSVPAGLAANVISATQINLTWNASTDPADAIASYTLFRNGVQRAVITAPTTSFNDTGLTASTTYTYTVLATDVSNNSSAQSAGVQATTPAASNAFNPPFPRIMWTGIGSTNWDNLVNNVHGNMQRIGDIGQQNAFGLYNVFNMAENYEGWTQAHGNRGTLISSIQNLSTAPLGTVVIQYFDPSNYYFTTASNFSLKQIFSNFITSQNWPVYANGSSGSIPLDPFGTPDVDIAQSTLTGGAYAGNTSLGETPSQWEAHYITYRDLNSNRSGSDAGRFTGLPTSGCAPTLAGTFFDNQNVDPHINGDYRRNGQISTSDNGKYQGIFSDDLARGQANKYLEYQRLNPGKLLCGNAGEYARAETGNTLANAGPMLHLLDMSFFETAIGRASAIETFNTFQGMINDMLQLEAFLNPNGAMIAGYQMAIPDTGVASLNFSSTPTAIGGEYQWARYALCCALMTNGYAHIHLLSQGYSPNISALRWYDEFDNAGAQKGYLGFPVDPEQSSQRVWYNGQTNGLWAREFQHGIAILNPRTGAGAITQPTNDITVTAAQLGIPQGRQWKRINGSQAPAINNGANPENGGFSIHVRDGIILLKGP